MLHKKLTTLSLLALTLLSGCGGQNNEKIIRVATHFDPMDGILRNIEPDLKEQGYKLEIIKFSDLTYKMPNDAVKNNEVDANMIQHKYFLANYLEGNKDADTEVYLPLYYSFFSIYSRDYTSLSEVKEGKSVIIPNDKYNIRRSLLLLDTAGLITLKNKEIKAISEQEVNSLIDNPLKLKFVFVGLTSLAATYKNSRDHLVTMYPTYAKSIGLTGTQERLFVEPLTEETKAYAITMAGRSSRRNEAKIKALINAVNSAKTKTWLEENYGEYALPALNLD